MPIYEYECAGCKSRFERMQRLSDPAVEVCVTCGGAVRKIISAPGIMFKGSGWYITDYARKSPDAKPNAAGDAQPKPATADATPSSSAPTATPPPAAKPAATEKVAAKQTTPASRG